MSLWWLQKGWTETRCARCGIMIYPEGDPDWGLCYRCFSDDLERNQMEAQQQSEYEAEMWSAYDAGEQP